MSISPCDTPTKPRANVAAYGTAYVAFAREPPAESADPVHTVMPLRARLVGFSCQNIRMRTHADSSRSPASSGSILSIGSSGSILSVGSSGSILSIGSAGSILSVGSVGSLASVLSVGSAASAGSILSALSRWSVLAWRSKGQAPFNPRRH